MNRTTICDIRPELMLQTICTLQDAGVEPDVWKIEGLDRREDCERVVETARRGGRDDVGCIVLGRGADEKKVVELARDRRVGAGIHRIRRRTHDVLGRGGRLRGAHINATRSGGPCGPTLP